MGIFKTKDYSKCLADITAVFSKTIRLKLSLKILINYFSK